MRKRTLGRSGLEVSAVGLGCNNFGGMIPNHTLEDARRVVHAALDAGVTLFDTSDSYGVDSGSERALGEIFGARRHDIVLATKFASPIKTSTPTGPTPAARYRGSRDYVMKAVEASLRRLNTDYIDLYQYHFPDPHTPIEETMRALDDLVRQGKVRYLGCSNMPAWRLVDAAWTARHHGFDRLLATQAEYSLLARGAESDLFAALGAARMTLLPYFPLANGMLTGKYRRGQPTPEGTRMSLPYFKSRLTQDRLDIVETLIAFCEARGKTILELAFSWLLAETLVTSVIAGATKPEQVRANAGAAGWRLTREELAGIRAILEPRE